MHPEGFGPEYVTVPRKPAAQTLHSVNTVLPVVAVVYPVGHEVQTAKPLENLPRGHMVHPAALAVPEPVTVPAYPAAQIVHADTDVLPEEDVVIPTGHGKQVEDPLAIYEPTGQG